MTVRTVRTVLLTVVLIGICFSPAWAGPPTEDGEAGTVASYEKTISDAKDNKDAALLRKKLGDYYASREDYKKAAEEFVKALSLSPTPFTRKERLQMAIAISWADRPDDAIRVLQSLLAENPQDRDARIHLAKVLSWSDRLQEAEAEADIVLKDYPENQDALLVKANTLRWRGEAAASIPVYEKALAQGENFDVRIGLASAYLAIGEKETAKEVGKPLQPLYPYQKREFAKFSDALCGMRASHIGIQYGYYGDSDHNRLNRSTLSYGFWAGRWEAELNARLTDAKDLTRHTKTEDVWMMAHSQTGRLGLSAGAGVSRMEDNDAAYRATGQMKADIGMNWGSVAVSASRDAFSDTAQLIENRIVRTSGSLGLVETFSPRLTLSESYTHSGYSDNNDADDFQLTARSAVLLSFPKISTGYRFRYWDFRRQSRSGYFDPNHFISHQIFVSLYAEKNAFYVSLDPYSGYQSFTRYGEKTSGIFAGFSASAGWRMKKCTSLELDGEGSNYAAGTAAGFNYYLLGGRLLVYF
jgi:tetratricopeptide (TPR) repeat protein